MFKICMKRYFASLRHIPGVLGILFIALLLGGSILFSGTKGAIGTMTNEISEATGQADLSVTRVFDAIKNNITDMFSSGDLNEDGSVLISSDEAKDAVNVSIEDALSETVDNYADYVVQVSGSVGTAIATILMLIVSFIIIQILSLIVGKWYVLIEEKTSFVKRGEHSFRGWLLHNGLVILSFLLIFVGFMINEYVGIVILVLYPLIYCVVSLLSSDLAIDKKLRLPMKEALHPKNVFVLLGTNLLQIVITVVLALIVASVANWVMAVYFVLSLVIISSAVVTINSDQIVLHLVEKANNKVVFEAETEEGAAVITENQNDEDTAGSGENVLKSNEAPEIDAASAENAAPEENAAE